jgi:hypothetical protein
MKMKEQTSIQEKHLLQFVINLPITLWVKGGFLLHGTH